VTGRLLVAGARTPRGQSPAALTRKENDVLAQLFGAMSDLCFLGWTKQPLADANATLEPKLRDPALMDHPKRAGYLETFQRRDLQMRLIDRRAEPFLAAFAQAWQRLPEPRRAAFRAEPGWPNEAVSVVLAHRVFAWFSSGGFWLAGKQEAPFGWLVVFSAIVAQRGWK
jgi:hypothetical protein